MKVVAYRRGVNTSWVSVPKMSTKCAARFLLLGKYRALEYEDGSVKEFGPDIR